jgi:hypothetical protein
MKDKEDVVNKEVGEIQKEADLIVVNVVMNLEMKMMRRSNSKILLCIHHVRLHCEVLLEPKEVFYRQKYNCKFN